MSNLTENLNRQALRSIEALQNSLVELLEEKTYQKITITEIAEKAGLTRATFYAHFETKDHLLDSIVNNVIDEFFEQIMKRDRINPNPDQDLKINQSFFRVWKENKHLIPLLESVDFDCLLVPRIRAFWDVHYENKTKKEDSGYNDTYASFTNNFLAYSYVGLLKEWIKQNMQTSPELMGEILYFFTGPPTLTEARKKFSDKF